MSIPGLDLSKIAENIVKIKHKPMLDQIEDEDERKAKTEELTKYYSEGDTAEGMQREMDTIEDGVTTIQSMLTNLQSSVAALPAAGITPQVIVTGAAAGAPNPAWPKLLNAAVKGSMLATVDAALYIYRRVLAACKQINFDPPGVVTALEAQIKSVQTTINAL